MELQLIETTKYLTKAGIWLPSSIKRRDPLEPGRDEKERIENRLYSKVIASFRRQKRAVRNVMNTYAPERKAFGFDHEFYMALLEAGIEVNEAEVAALARILRTATDHGILLFGETVSFDIDYTIVNEQAAKWANKHAGEFITKVNLATKKVVRSAISDFVRTPGMTIGDVVARLPFNESRAWRIAVTETTNTYANASVIAGEALEKAFPTVKVIKRWYTNNDDKVCPICGPLHNQVVLMKAMFKGGQGVTVAHPAAHVNCRCWMDVSTRL